MAKTITIYERGDIVVIPIGRKRRGQRQQTEKVKIVAPWAPGEGSGFAVCRLGKGPVDSFDIRASKILRLA